MKNIWVLSFALIMAITLFSGCEQPTTMSDDTKATESKDSEEGVSEDGVTEEGPNAMSFWSPERTKLRVVVSIPPQKYFVEQIGGANVEVISLLEEGDEFLTSTPSDAKLAVLAEADLYFMIGAPFETSISMPSTVVGVDTRKDVNLKPYSSHTEYLNASKNNKNDPFFWLSPTMVIQSSSSMYLNLRDRISGDRETVRTNYTHFVRDLNNLEGDIHRVLLNAVNSEVYTDYPVLGYFGITFNIKQKQFDSKKGGDINTLARSAIKEDVHTIFFGPYLPEGIKGNLEDLINGTVSAINPLQESYANNLLQIAEAIASGSSKAQ